MKTERWQLKLITRNCKQLCQAFVVLSIFSLTAHAAVLPEDAHQRCLKIQRLTELVAQQRANGFTETEIYTQAYAHGLHELTADDQWIIESITQVYANDQLSAELSSSASRNQQVLDSTAACYQQATRTQMVN
jgi:hypothetical protein